MLTYKKRLMTTTFQKGSLLFLVFIVITGCGDRQVKSSDIELQRQVIELEQELYVYKIENENFPQIINNSLTFIEAMERKDIKTLENMLSVEYELIEQDNHLFAKKVDNPFLWQLDQKEQRQGLTLQNYAYDAEKDAFFIQIRLLYKDSSGNIQSPPNFINLTYDRSWKVIDLEFDV